MDKLKQIPYALTKSQLVAYCHPVPDSKVRQRINEIIFDKRKNLPDCKNLKREQIIKTHLVERNEIVEYFETYGIPEGYTL